MFLLRIEVFRRKMTVFVLAVKNSLPLKTEYFIMTWKKVITPRVWAANVWVGYTRCCFMVML